MSFFIWYKNNDDGVNEDNSDGDNEDAADDGDDDDDEVDVPLDNESNLNPLTMVINNNTNNIIIILVSCLYEFLWFCK